MAERDYPRTIEGRLQQASTLVDWLSPAPGEFFGIDPTVPTYEDPSRSRRFVFENTLEGHRVHWARDMWRHGWVRAHQMREEAAP